MVCVFILLQSVNIYLFTRPAWLESGPVPEERRLGIGKIKERDRHRDRKEKAGAGRGHCPLTWTGTGTVTLNQHSVFILYSKTQEVLLQVTTKEIVCILWWA